MVPYAAKNENLVIQNQPPQAVALEQEGIEALNKDNPAQAVHLFAEAYSLFPSPISGSFLAYCLVLEKKGGTEALPLAIKSLREDPRNPVLYLNLGRIQSLLGRKRDAVRMFMKGQGFEIKVRKSIFHDDLVKLGVRKQPPIPLFPRGNLFNKYLGLLLTRLGLR